MEISDFRLPPFFFSFKKAEIQLITLVKKNHPNREYCQGIHIGLEKTRCFLAIAPFFRFAKLEFVYLF